jgi:NADPH:quinone reductase-like Zn-dependent oxidoreductase
MAGATALRGIWDVGAVRAGHRVLVNGAAGGVGTYAVQIAAALGAEVTGVCSTRNVELVRSIGAAHVVDYTTEDFTDGRAHYDVILDNVCNRPLSRLRRALTPTGALVLNGGGSPGRVVGAVGSLLERSWSTVSSESGSD